MVARRRGRFQKGGVQILDLRHRTIRRVGDQRQAGGGVELNRLVFDRPVNFQVLKIIILGILGHDGQSHNQRYVVGRLFGQDIQAPQFPKIRIAGTLYRALHATRAAIVGGHGQIPIPEHGIQIVQMPGGCPRSLLRI